MNFAYSSLGKNSVRGKDSIVSGSRGITDVKDIQEEFSGFHLFKTVVGQSLRELVKPDVTVIVVPV